MEEFSELKSARLLSIYARLLNGQVLKKALLAQEFGVTARSIQRDLESLRSFLSNEMLPQDVVYDRAAGNFTLMNSSKILGDGNTGSPIYTAAMGKDGTLAFSLKTSSAQSELCVYNHKLEKIFAWECAQEKIFDISLARNGKSAALILVG